MRIVKAGPRWIWWKKRGVSKTPWVTGVSIVDDVYIYIYIFFFGGLILNRLFW